MGKPVTEAQVGSFVWYDLLTEDPAKAVSFYSHVVGWESQAFGPEYTMFAAAQGPLGGTTKLPDQAKKMGAPPHWTSNVRVADVDATVALARKLGGKVHTEPSDYPNVGRLAIIGDPQGAMVNVFKPAREMTAHDPTKTGEFVWHELMAAEHETAFGFYSQLFGWKKSRDFDMGAMGKYQIFGAGGADLGGMMTKPKEMPLPPHWLYYVQVADLDAAVQRAKGKGAKLLNGPMPVPGGARIAQLMDPQGAAFALHEPAKTA
jgi:predicted enzyme related to lactoylglutathione lyase